ncbi:MAG: peroxiredoxin [Candidatus Dadabacteria bacterium]|nr:peroxiredoxin [Candidatus Dadabacteria bacterium]NIT13138.1 peroxiredoxin [Candidatus Dadabacteria bacterium]
MTEDTRKLVVVITCGLEDERMSVAWSVANGGISSGLEVTIFLASSAIDCVRKGAADKVHLNPLDPPIGDMINKFTSRGGKILACPPCSAVRGYSEENLLKGVVIIGSSAIHELIKEGAATLSF